MFIARRSSDVNKQLRSPLRVVHGLFELLCSGRRRSTGRDSIFQHSTFEDLQDR
jgi:hypothetical protein